METKYENNKDMHINPSVSMLLYVMDIVYAEQAPTAGEFISDVLSFANDARFSVEEKAQVLRHYYELLGF